MTKCGTVLSVMTGVLLAHTLVLLSITMHRTPDLASRIQSPIELSWRDEASLEVRFRPIVGDTPAPPGPTGPSWASRALSYVSGRVIAASMLVAGRQLCPAGSYSLSCSKCAPCPSGTFRRTYDNLVSGGCTQCPAGTYSVQSLPASLVSCTPCPEGTVSAAPGAAACSPCPDGSFRDSSVPGPATSCSPCPVGKFSVWAVSPASTVSCQVSPPARCTGRTCTAKA